MVSSKRTGGTVDGFIEGHQGGKTEHLGPLPLSMVSSKGALGQGALSMVSSKDTMEGGIPREQGIPHAQRDIRGISPAICRQEGVASIYFFPNQIFFELVDRNEGACRRYAIQQCCWQDKG